jgi:hypothetical protein
MKTQTKMVTLANGKQVTWDEFVTWSPVRQAVNLRKGRNGAKAMGQRPWDATRSIKFSKHYRDIFKLGRKKTQNFGSNNPSSRRVSTPDGVFPSRKSAAAFYGVSTQKMYQWITLENPLEFYYLDPPQQKKSHQAVNTPDGIFDSLQAAANFYKVTPKTIKDWIKRPANQESKQFQYIDSPRMVVPPRSKPVISLDDGYFPSLKAAADFYGVEGVTVKRWIKGKGRMAGRLRWAGPQS